MRVVGEAADGEHGIAIDERVWVLNSRFTFATGGDGATVRVSVPAYAATAAS